MRKQWCSLVLGAAFIVTVVAPGVVSAGEPVRPEGNGSLSPSLARLLDEPGWSLTRNGVYERKQEEAGIETVYVGEAGLTLFASLLSARINHAAAHVKSTEVAQAQRVRDLVRFRQKVEGFLAEGDTGSWKPWVGEGDTLVEEGENSCEVTLGVGEGGGSTFAEATSDCIEATSNYARAWSEADFRDPYGGWDWDYEEEIDSGWKAYVHAESGMRGDRNCYSEAEVTVFGATLTLPWSGDCH